MDSGAASLRSMWIRRPVAGSLTTMKRDLEGKTIIITGASSGIGAATAVRCAMAGMDLVINARRAERLEDVASSIAEQGRRAVIVVGDVTEDGISRHRLEAAENEFGEVYAVFANAGYGMNKTVISNSDQDLRRMFDVNFFAATELLRMAGRRLMDSERPGHLLMCSSCVSKFALPNHGAYSATKSAQNGICGAMRHELKPHGIYVSSVHPITTTTEFFEVSARVSNCGDGAADIPSHTPRLFVQPPDRVARAVVKCLQRPRPEVWTSHIVRTVAGFMTIFPRFYDWSMRKVVTED